MEAAVAKKETKVEREQKVDGAQAKEAGAPEIKIKGKAYRVEVKNWVGVASQKGKPMNPKTVKGILDDYPGKKYLKTGETYYVMDLSLGDDGLLVAKVKKGKKPEGKVVGWYNKANQMGRKKLGVYNLCRSIREVVAAENGINNPNVIQVLIETQ